MLFRRKIDERQLASLARSVQDAEETLRTVLKRVAAAEEALDELSAAHLRLRGRVYAVGLHKGGVEEKPAEMSREELRRHVTQTGRFTPGKPPIHRE